MLGLIQVMKNLANIDEVGHGIAVAFVATVYGVGVGEPASFCRRRARSRLAGTREIAAQGADSRRRLRHRGGAESEADPGEAAKPITGTVACRQTSDSTPVKDAENQEAPANAEA